MKKKGIETVEHDYLACYECGSFEDCDCEGYNQALQDVLPVIERAVAAERQFILNILDGIDIADEEMGNNGGGTKAIRLALKSRIITPLPDKE